MRILQEKAATFTLEEWKLNGMLKTVKIQFPNDILSCAKDDEKCKDVFEFMINCDAGEDNLKNVDNLVNAIKTNHEGTECDSKWAVCYALAIPEPSKPPGAKMEGSDILLD